MAGNSIHDAAVDDKKTSKRGLDHHLMDCCEQNRFLRGILYMSKGV